jgi:hypothetical protein
MKKYAAPPLLSDFFCVRAFTVKPGGSQEKAAWARISLKSGRWVLITRKRSSAVQHDRT